MTAVTATLTDQAVCNNAKGFNSVVKQSLSICGIYRLRRKDSPQENYFTKDTEQSFLHK